jgi:hypothetical protein
MSSSLFFFTRKEEEKEEKMGLSTQMSLKVNANNKKASI